VNLNVIGCRFLINIRFVYCYYFYIFSYVLTHLKNHAFFYGIAGAVSTLPSRRLVTLNSFQGLISYEMPKRVRHDLAIGLDGVKKLNNGSLTRTG
jgi:hypothetical protein